MVSLEHAGSPRSAIQNPLWWWRKEHPKALVGFESLRQKRRGAGGAAGSFDEDVTGALAPREDAQPDTEVVLGNRKHNP